MQISVLFEETKYALLKCTFTFVSKLEPKMLFIFDTKLWKSFIGKNFMST